MFKIQTSNNLRIIKPTTCTNFSNLFLEWKTTCFGQFLFPSSGVFHRTHSNGICHTGLLTACEQDQDGTNVPSWSCLQAVNKPVWHRPFLCVQWKTPDDGHRNYPKYVEFHSKNKFEKLMHVVGFIIRKLTRYTVTWTSGNNLSSSERCCTIPVKTQLSKNAHKIIFLFSAFLNANFPQTFYIHIL